MSRQRRCSPGELLPAHSFGELTVLPTPDFAMTGSDPSDTHSHVTRQPLEAATDIAALPFTVPDAGTMLSNTEPDGDLNRFRVRAGQSLAEWEKAGWIWAEDPRGWAQWYTRFWEGRRCDDDERQVRRCQ